MISFKVSAAAMFAFVMMIQSQSVSAAPANVALNRPASASSIYPGPSDCPACYYPAQAVDANAAPWSRWSSKVAATSSAPQYLDVDLGKLYKISSIALGSGKENGYGKLVDFKLQSRKVSSSAFANVAGAAIAGNASASRTLSFTPVEARYVRILCTKAADDGICRIYDLKVMGEAIANRAPIVNAGADLAIQLPANSATLTGSASDPDGDALTYAWSKISGGAASIASPSAAKTAISGLVAGSYTFRLTAKDSKGLSASNDVIVTVKAAAVNQAPKALAGADQSITLPVSSITLNGSATDSDGTIASYAWSKVSGGAAVIASPSAAKSAVSGLVAGAYVFRLTVKDNKGASASDDVAVNVKPAPVNQAPKALAGADLSITLPVSSVTLNGSGTDADGTIASYAWSKVSGGAAVIASPSAAKTAVSGLVAGSYVFRLTVKDNKGASALDDVKVTVNPAASGGGKTILVGNGSGELVISSNMGAACGDTIGIRSGTYVGVSISNLTGCVGNPITLTNSGGEVRVYAYQQGQWGFELKSVKNVVMKPATAGTYGFRIDNRVGRVGLTISQSSENVDVSGVHVVEASHGFAVKTDPDCSLLDHVYPKQIRGIKIHHSLVENTLYEGMYAGYYNAGDVTLNCSGVTKVVKAERIAKVEVYNNQFKNTGNEAIKLRLCLEGCDIHDNQISGYGVTRTDDSAWCFGIQVGSETYGKIYRNTIDHGYCSAIDVRTDSLSMVEIFGNDVSSAGTLPNGSKGASWAGSILFNVLKPGQQFYIHDNLSQNPNGHDVEVTNYGPHSYSGRVCNSGPDVFVTPGAPSLQPCP